MCVRAHVCRRRVGGFVPVCVSARMHGACTATGPQLSSQYLVHAEVGGEVDRGEGGLAAGRGSNQQHHLCGV